MSSEKTVQQDPPVITADTIMKQMQSKAAEPYPIDLGHSLIGSLIGALIAVLIAVLVFSEADVSYANILWALFIGAFGGFLLVAAFMYFSGQSRDAFEKENDLRREAIRRQER